MILHMAFQSFQEMNIRNWLKPDFKRIVAVMRDRFTIQRLSKNEFNPDLKKDFACQRFLLQCWTKDQFNRNFGKMVIGRDSKCISARELAD